MPLTYLPTRTELFLWGEDSAPLASLAELGAPASADVVTFSGLTHVEGRALMLFPAVARLAAVPAAELAALPGSVAAWALASKLVLDLTSRERIVPTVIRQKGEKTRARWAAVLQAPEDAARVADIARSLTPAAHAVPAESAAPVRAGASVGSDESRSRSGERRPRSPAPASRSAAPASCSPAPASRSAAPERSSSRTPLLVWAPDALLRVFLDAAVDALVRAAARTGQARSTKDAARWEDRWVAALAGPDDSFEARGFGERTLIEDLEAWSRPVLGGRERPRACFRLELPTDGSTSFALRFLLQSPDDPSLLVDAAEVWRTRGGSLAKLGRAFRDPQESLLEALGR
ncbi:MAG TPA: ATP-dependent helicase, partial [Gammaproteobacteria bacterium]|nr:ATP-dependent helicase [Gammaproteobacteria bacterium]